jgi:hypothetical protein
MRTTEIIGVASSIVALAMLSIAVIYGDRTAKVIGAAGSAFTSSIRAATLR